MAAKYEIDIVMRFDQIVPDILRAARLAFVSAARSQIAVCCDNRFAVPICGQYRVGPCNHGSGGTIVGPILYVEDDIVVAAG